MKKEEGSGASPFQLAEVKLKYKSAKKPSQCPIIKSPEEAAHYLRSIWDMESIELAEDFMVLLLNASKHCLGWARVSRGGLTATIVDPAAIFRLALLCNSHSLVVAHNHPSSNPIASQSDIRLTKRLVEAGKLLGITLEDHIILTRYDYTSLREKGLI
ncbi:MAG: JAB domain-containing protein [Candidatus Babeliales bacterium]